MKLKEILKDVCEMVGKNDLMDGINNETDLFLNPDLSYIYCLLDENLRETAREYSYYEKSKVRSVDGKIYYTFFPTEAFEISNIKLNDENIEFSKESDSCVSVNEDNEYLIEYRTYPKLKNLEDEFPENAQNILLKAIFKTVAEYEKNNIRL